MISLFFKKGEKQERSHTSKKQVKRNEKSGGLQNNKPETGSPIVSLAEKKERSDSIGKTEEKLARSPRTAQKKPLKTSSVIETWTGEDMIKGIILTEVLGPPKSKRKK